MLVSHVAIPAATSKPATASSSGRSMPVIGSVVTVLDVTVGVVGTGAALVW
jgi:hypothetical protein